MAALLNLGTVTSPEQIRAILQACPELVTDGADAERELLSALGWPPEAGRLAEARAELIRVLTSSVTDAELESAYQTFDEARESRPDADRRGRIRQGPLARGAPRRARSGVGSGRGAGPAPAGARRRRARSGRCCSTPSAPGSCAGLTRRRPRWRGGSSACATAGSCGTTSATVTWRPRLAMNLASALYAWDYGDAYATAGEAEAVHA